MSKYLLRIEKEITNDDRFLSSNDVQEIISDYINGGGSIDDVELFKCESCNDDIEILVNVEGD